MTENLKIMGFLSRLNQRRIRLLARNLQPYIKDGDIILDYGCGDGRFASQLLALSRQHGKRVEIVGYDPVPQATQHSTLPIYHSLSSIPQKRFSLCLLIDVVHHMGLKRSVHDSSSDCLSRELKHMLPFLLPDGRILIKDYVISSMAFLALLQRGSLVLKDILTNPRSVNTPFVYLTRSDWQVLFQRLQLRLLSERNTPYLPFESWYQHITGVPYVFHLHREVLYTRSRSS